MKLIRILLISLLAFSAFSCTNQNDGKHLFILSGQSNMQGLDPEESFLPAIEAEFGAENVLVVKDAKGGQPIRRWFKDWDTSQEEGNQAHPDMYDSLMNKLHPAMENQKIETISFIWMQGERDAREELGEEYERNLIKLYHQICRDIKREDINFIVGRLSDFDMDNVKYPHWTLIREAQVTVAEYDPHFVWVNTDDLNDGFNKQGNRVENDLHMSEDGYVELGKRFAEQAISLINN